MKRKLRIYLVLVFSPALIMTFALFFHHGISSVIGILLGVIATIYLLVFISQLKKFWEKDPIGRPIDLNNEGVSSEGM